MQRGMTEISPCIDFNPLFNQFLGNFIFVTYDSNMKSILSFMITPVDIRKICILKRRKIILQFIKEIF